MSTVNPSPGAAYGTCSNCGYPLHQTAPAFDAIDLQHRLPAGDPSSRWVHPGSAMTGTCPRCGARSTFTHGSGQTGFHQ